MLLPPFRGVDMKAYANNGDDITDDLFAPNGFLRVDADYAVKPFEEWTPEDWPKTYQCPRYANVFGVGIAFAPPHAISEPKKSRTGRSSRPRRHAPDALGRHGAHRGPFDRRTNPSRGPGAAAHRLDGGDGCGVHCLGGYRTSQGQRRRDHDVPDHPRPEAFPGSGRDSPNLGRDRLSGHWTKLLLHYLFIYKAKARFGWFMIPSNGQSI